MSSHIHGKTYTSGLPEDLHGLQTCYRKKLHQYVQIILNLHNIYETELFSLNPIDNTGISTVVGNLQHLSFSHGQSSLSYQSQAFIIRYFSTYVPRYQNKIFSKSHDTSQTFQSSAKKIINITTLQLMIRTCDSTCMG